MKTPDLERERSEKKRSMAEFMELYNEGLPSCFPRATLPSLASFKRANSALFKDSNDWTLDQHRKKFMEWIPRYIKNNSF